MAETKPVVLAVDDTPANLDVLNGILCDDYKVKVAPNGPKALELARREPRPDVILLDIMMPDMSGYEVCEQLKADAETASIPVIFVTAKSEVEDEQKGLALGAVDYITKPFHPDIVKARVSRHLASHQRTRELIDENRELRDSKPRTFTDFDETSLVALIDSGEGHALEFKSTLRWNLHADRADKNIENACLKTVAGYLNTDGGVLFIGVTDEGEPIGLDKDGFKSEDKLLQHWDNLLTSSLGAEFMRSIRSTLHTVSERRVLVVECLPAKAPVFFKRENDEAFYARMASSTRSLKPSEVLTYIGQHFSNEPAPGLGPRDAPVPQPDPVARDTLLLETIVHQGSLVGPDGIPGLQLPERYDLDEAIGSGGMATVYLAQDTKLGRPVAVKVLRHEVASAVGAERFLREIRITANLEHPHILALHDSGDANGFLFYVMTYVDGESLRDLLRREGPLEIEPALRITRQIASALDYAHRQGVIHRDIKPANILLKDGRALVADFGIALGGGGEQSTRLTEVGFSLGTPCYMSPEQVTNSDVDGRSDEYSLACVLYEMLTGQPPFVGSNAQSIFRLHMVEKPPRMGAGATGRVPEHVEDAVHKALAKQPDDRYPAMEDFARALAGSAATSGPRTNAVRMTAVVVALASIGAFMVLLLAWMRSP